MWPMTIISNDRNEDTQLEIIAFQLEENVTCTQVQNSQYRMITLMLLIKMTCPNPKTLLYEIK